MSYDGPLYGRIGRKYFPTGKTAADYDQLEAATAWQPPETAPKDGTVILGDFGWPWPLVAAWDDHSQRWAVAMPAADERDEVFNRRFETDTEGYLGSWMPLPKIKRKEEGAL